MAFESQAGEFLQKLDLYKVAGQWKVDRLYNPVAAEVGGGISEAENILDLIHDGGFRYLVSFTPCQLKNSGFFQEIRTKIDRGADVYMKRLVERLGKIGVDVYQTGRSIQIDGLNHLVGP